MISACDRTSALWKGGASSGICWNYSKSDGHYEFIGKYIIESDEMESWFEVYVFECCQFLGSDLWRRGAQMKLAVFNFW